MAKGKNVLTRGDVAKICNVAPRTVSKWFDSGQLKGYRIPGSKDRRIPLPELLRFMEANNIPTSLLETGHIRVLIANSSEQKARETAKQLSDKTDYEILTAESNFATGILTEKFKPHVILVYLKDRNISSIDICSSIHNSSEHQTVKVIAVTSRLNPTESKALLEQGFDSFVFENEGIQAVIDAVEQATAIVY